MLSKSAARGGRRAFAVGLSVVLATVMSLPLEVPQAALAVDNPVTKVLADGLDSLQGVIASGSALEELAEAVRMTAGRVLLEASGGVTLDTVPQIAATGVDFISVGALTHSARAIDFSLELLS